MGYLCVDLKPEEVLVVGDVKIVVTAKHGKRPRNTRLAIDAPRAMDIRFIKKVRGSQVVRQLTVNEPTGGSTPSPAATKPACPRCDEGPAKCRCDDEI